MFYLGVDAGGTKTYAVVVDDQGQKMGEGKALGANVHNVSIEEGFGHIQEAILMAYADANFIEGEIEAGCVGISGLDCEADRRRVKDYWQQNVYSWKVKELMVVNDGLVGLRSGTSQQGVCLVCGTGANCFGISNEGEEAIAGDWGYILGDQGSGYALGRSFLWQTVKELDGRSEPWMADKVLEKLGLQTMDDLVEWAYIRETSAKIAQIASLCGLRNDETLKLSQRMEQFMRNVVDELELAYRAVVGKLGLMGEFDVVMMGGVLQEEGFIVDNLREAVRVVSPEVRIIVPEKEPVYGAIALAQDMSLYGNNSVKINF